MVRWVWVFVFLLVFLGHAPLLKADFHKACDSFVFLADESESMFNNDRIENRPKIDIEKDIMSLINKDVPAVDYVAALRTFGHAYTFSNPYQSALYYAPGPYNKETMAEAIQKIRASRAPTPLGYGLELAGKDAQKMPGKVHIVMFTDGNENAYRPSSEVAQEIKQNLGDKVCLYVVQVGHCPKSKSRLENLVSIIGCGKLFNAFDLENNTARQAFIKEVFGYEMPSPQAKPLPPMKDSDGDGVYDKDDQCPNTPKGAPVDARGCWKLGMVFFEFDKTDIKPQFEPLLDEIATVLQKNPDVKIRVIGSTDALGTEEYNYKLGLRRAENVKNYLVKHGVSHSQIIVISVGEKAPIADNNTPEGRAKNRHVRFELAR